MRTYFSVLCGRFFASYKPVADVEVIRWENPFNELKNSLLTCSPLYITSCVSGLLTRAGSPDISSLVSSCL